MHILRLLLLTSATAALIGCGAGNDDASIDYLDASDEALSVGGESAGFAMAPFGMVGLRPGPQLGCDADPQVTWGDICGHSYPATIELAWDGCTTFMRDGTSTGTVSITHTMELQEGTCDAGGVIAITHHAVVDVQRQNGDDTLLLSGTVDASGSRTVDAPPSAVDVTMAWTRTRKRNDLERTVDLAGSFNLALARDADPPTQTINGELTGSIDGPRGHGDLAATITDLVRVPPPVCRFPTSGTINTVRGDQSHLIEFGPACGDATRDGEEVTLPLRRMRHMGNR